MYNPMMILGQSDKISIIEKETMKNLKNQKHDVKLIYKCDKTYTLLAQPEPTVFTKHEYIELIVDPNTCEPAEEDDFTRIANKSIEDKKEGYDKKWGSMEFILLSLMVSSSFLAGYNPLTFYSGIVYILFTPIRAAFIFYTFTAFHYELTNPDSIVKLIEACYMFRHEQNLIAEEEAYRMLQEIMRSPELLKALSGSSLRGSIHPKLDNLSH